jgi:PadR family transcriptional regulator PadR
MGKGFLTHTAAVILQAIANGYQYGFDIIDITGVPGGTVYPALRRLEDAGHLTSRWEAAAVARAEPRPPRKYYELTRSGRDALEEAARRFRLLELAQRKPARTPRPARA